MKIRTAKNKARGWLYTRALITNNRAERSALLEEIRADCDRGAITTEERAELIIAVVMSNTMAGNAFIGFS